MRPLVHLAVIAAMGMIALRVDAQKASDRYRNVPAGGVLSRGPLPELEAFTAEGKPLKLRDLCAGKYTVLSVGCLTCPLFHQNYPEIEAAYADYAKRGVQFFYVYKSLRHPELNGYVPAQNMSERLRQLAEAKRMLGTRVPWIADTMEDSVRVGLRAGSYSVYLISPEGEIVYAADKIDGYGLRAALANAAGPVARPTRVSQLDLPRITRPAGLVNEDSAWGVKRPDGLNILALTPARPEETYYVKLRAEADDQLLRSGTGRLFLGFYPDPIHDAHWNNLAPPMEYTLTLPDGVTATPVQAAAQKGMGDSDTQPRQFWVDIASAKPFESLQLKLNYFACTPDLCMALTHGYTVEMKARDDGSRTYGMNKGNRSGSSRGGSRNAAGGGSRLQQMDTNHDRAVSFEELCAQMKKQRPDGFSTERARRRFDAMDMNKDGQLSASELENMPRRQRF